MNNLPFKLLSKTSELPANQAHTELTDQNKKVLEHLINEIANSEDTHPRLKARLKIKQVLEEIKQDTIDSYENVETLLPGGCVRDGMQSPTTSDQVINSQQLLWAVSNHDQNQLSTLLKHPSIDINTKGTYGETPLHVAIILGHDDAAKMLIEHGADISIMAYGDYADDLDGFSPLEMALENHQDNLVELMLQEGQLSHFDQEDLFFIAASYNLVEIFLELMADNVYEDMPDSFLQQLAILKLIETTEDIFSDSGEMDIQKMQDSATILCELAQVTGTVSGSHLWPDDAITPLGVWIEMFLDSVTDVDAHQILLETASKLNQLDDNRSHFVNAKMLFHILQVEGEYKVKYDGQHKPITGSIDAEGFLHCFTVPVMLQGLDSYLSKVGPKMSSDIHQAFVAAQQAFSFSASFARSYGLESTAEQFYDAFQNDQTIVIPTGWPKHAVDVILDKATGMLAIANNGWSYHGLDSGSTVFKIHNPDGVTPELIHNILLGEDKADIEINLAAKLGLEQVNHLPEPSQIVGNCAWASHESAVESLLFFDLLKQGFEPEQAATLASDNYHDWSDYMAYTFAKWYFDGDVRIDDAGVEALLKAHAAKIDTQDVTLLKQDPLGKLLVDQYENLSGKSADTVDLSPEQDKLDLADLLEELKILDFDPADNATQAVDTFDTAEPTLLVNPMVIEDVTPMPEMI